LNDDAISTLRKAPDSFTTSNLKTSYYNLAKCIHADLIIRTLGRGTGSNKFEKKGNTDYRQLAIKGSSGKIVFGPAFGSSFRWDCMRCRKHVSGFANITKTKFVLMHRCTDLLKNLIATSQF
jgi:hypothetical protein